MRRYTVLFLIVFLFGLTTLRAQGTAVVDGTVVDTSKSAVPGAHVTLVEADTGETRTAVSSSQGYFTFPDLSPGRYTLKVSLKGFQTWTQQNIVLAVDQHATLRPVLAVGAITQTVRVTAGAPLVTTSTSTLSTLVGTRQITELPLNGRDALQLVTLSPGVVSTGTTGQFGSVENSYAVSGGRDIDVNYMLDGGDDINPFYAQPINFPNPDALQEFAVSSRDYSAQYGRGSTQVSAVTRSGTNQFHGSAFEFVRNEVFDSRPFFEPGRPGYKRNQFGGTFGGPIHRNKLFFFVGYQGTQTRGSPGSVEYTTLTTAERTGDFSGLSTSLINPATGAPFPGNVIPSTSIEPQAAKFISEWLPAANLGTGDYSFTPTTSLKENQVIGKVDAMLSQKDHLAVRYLFDNVPQINVNGDGSGLDTSWLSSLPTRYQSATADYTHTFSPTLLNDLNVTYVRSAFGDINTSPKNFSLTDLGYPVSTGNAFDTYGMTPDSDISIGGYFSVYPGAPTRDIMPTWYVKDSASWVHGIHSLNFGMELYRNRVNELQNFFTGGDLNFTGMYTGNGAADFLLGNFDSYEQIEGLTSRLHQTLPSFYAEDGIKATRRVTVNAGLRWDPVSAYSSQDLQLSTFVPGKQSTLFPLAVKGILYPGDDGLPNNIVGTRWDNLAPRLGVAWDVFGNGKTSIRAGGGVYYIPLTRGITWNRFTLIEPFDADIFLYGGDAANLWAPAPYNGVDPFPFPAAGNLAALKKVSFAPFAGEGSIALPFRTQTDNEWSLSIQQQLWRNALLEVDYSGSSSSDLMTSWDSNPARYIPGTCNGLPCSTEANTQSRLLDPQIGNIETIGDRIGANYNALQISFRQTYSHGITVASYYTYSKALGIVAAEGEGDNGPRDPFDFELNYGPQTWNLTNNWITSFLWQPQAHHFSNRLVGGLLNNWGLTGILTGQSGAPFTLYSGVDNSFSDIGGDTPDQVGRWQLPGGRSTGQQLQEWFNTKAFVPNAIGTFGNVGEDSLYGPGYWEWDTALLRNFIPREGYRLEFRASFYNILNHPDFSAPVNTLTSPDFGEILSQANDPREIEFSLRLTF
jgi:Carboxypeptidase regulatory-like domain